MQTREQKNKKVYFHRQTNIQPQHSQQAPRARRRGAPDPSPPPLHAPCCHVISTCVLVCFSDPPVPIKCFVSDSRAPSSPALPGTRDGTLVFRGTETDTDIQNRMEMEIEVEWAHTYAHAHCSGCIAEVGMEGGVCLSLGHRPGVGLVREGDEIPWHKGR